MSARLAELGGLAGNPQNTLVRIPEICREELVVAGVLGDLPRRSWKTTPFRLSDRCVPSTSSVSNEASTSPETTGPGLLVCLSARVTPPPSRNTESPGMERVTVMPRMSL